jgi:hypothetical protein
VLAHGVSEAELGLTKTRFVSPAESCFPRNTPSGSRSPPGAAFILWGIALVNQGDAGRVRGLKFVFAAGVAQEGADDGPHRLMSGSLRLAGVTNPSRGSA